MTATHTTHPAHTDHAHNLTCPTATDAAQRAAEQAYDRLLVCLSATSPSNPHAPIARDAAWDLAADAGCGALDADERADIAATLADMADAAEAGDWRTAAGQDA